MIDRPARLHYLDGIRGWGALVVLLYHNFVLVFYPHPVVPSVLWHIAFFNGTLAVFIFFLVSGYSLSIGFFSGGGRPLLIRLAAGRYFRLTLPILVASLGVYLTFCLGWVAPIEQRPADLQQALHAAPSFLQTLRFGTFDVFFNYHLETSPIPPLWTMPYELGASFIILGLLAFCGASRFFWIWLSVLGFFIVRHQPYYAPFFIGVLLARAHGQRWWTMALGKLAPFCFCVGLLIAYDLKDFSHLNYNASALMLFISFIYWAPLRKFVENRVSLYLGRISFPLYLVHSPMFYTASIAFLNMLRVRGADQTTALVFVSVANIPLAVFLAQIFTPIDTASISLARNVGRFVSRIAA